MSSSDKPWFIRICTPVSYRIEPYSRAGWIVTAIYVLGAMALGSVPAFRPPNRVGWIAWSIVFAAWTIGYLVILIRNSEPASVELDRNKRPS